ncbi:hypothetical protein SHKM778_33280 [Streptomyces sp. KM77-8]|uniref:Uncharacterized protein n=1 Tax=Streptomyces haneummycinicus TaxID=3074435 RepID=A0AAT9HHI4_9ACTN
MSSRTVIRGGLVITASDEIHADVLIEDGRIAASAGPPAARGSTTTVVGFAVQQVGQSLRQETLKEVDLLVEEGVTSFKGFIRPPDQGFSSGVCRVPSGMAA